jgi:lipoate-protein ligase B
MSPPVARPLLVLDLGHREYGQAYEQMLRLHELRAEGQIPDVLILVEHPHVVTLGRRGTREQVFDQTLPMFEVERGGMATYHGPGQLVAYPIVSLKDAGWGVKQVVQAVANASAGTLQRLGIADAKPGETKELVGVWVGPKKLASIGLAIRRDVSLHGVAINLNTDLSYFERISPCGMDASVMTSAQRILGQPVDLSKAGEIFTAEFAALLGASPQRVTEADLLARLRC